MFRRLIEHKTLFNDIITREKYTPKKGKEVYNQEVLKL